MTRSIAAVVTTCLFALAGCGGNNASSPDGGPDAGPTCQTVGDCPSGNVCDPKTHLCVPVCHSSADCASGQVCEEGTCLAPACGGPSDCTSTQDCVGGACQPKTQASSVQSCDVIPSPAVVHVGSTVQLSVIPRDASGAPLYYAGSVAWTAAGAGVVDAAGGLVTGNSAGSVTVTAAIGTHTCMGSVTSYAAAADGAVRVTVIDQHTKQPVVGAKVALDSIGNLQTTAADGTAVFTGITGTHDVHVFAAGYNYVSFLDVPPAASGATADLLVPLAAYTPRAQQSGFSGHMCSSIADDPTCKADDQFLNLAVQGEGFHLGFFGSGIPNSLLDISVDTLIGPTHTVHLSLGTNSKDLPLPYGLVLGVGSNLFGTQDFRMYANGGKRALWGIGGNLNLTQVVTALGPLFTGGGTGGIDIGTILPAVLPLLGTLEAGATVGVTAPANAAPPTFQSIDLPLNTPLRLRVSAKSPNLPTLDGKYVDGVIALAGALDYPQGFVPLGFTAGLAYKDSSSVANGKIVDPSCDTSGGLLACATNNLPLKFASENGGTEGSPYGIALVALNLGSLSGGVTGTVALSGLLQAKSEVKYVPPPAAGTDVNFPAQFLSLPNSGSVTLAKTGRQLSITSDADSKIQIYRFELENAARLGWEIWMAPTGCIATPTTPCPGRQKTLPDPHAVDASFIDPLQPAVDANNNTVGPTARILGMQLAGPNSSKTAVQLETFGSLTLDQIGANLTGFIAASAPIN